MGLLSGSQLQRFFVKWIQTSDGKQVAIDGKTLHGTADKRIKNRAIHMVRAFSAANRVVLGQVKWIPNRMRSQRYQYCLTYVKN